MALTGDSASGKSTLMTAWARDAIADGRSALILDRENPRGIAFDRMRRLGLQDGTPLRWWGGWIGEVPGPDSPQVIAWVRSQQSPLVVVDSLIAFLGGDENDAREMRRFMNHLRRLADMGATVVVIHHDGKADSARDFRGSSDFKAAVDQAFHVSNLGPTGLLEKIRLRCFKSRYGLTGDLAYHYAAGAMVRDAERLAPERTQADALGDLLRLNPGVTGEEFEKKSASAGITRGRARDFLNDGVMEGSVSRITGNHNVKRYHLSEAQND